MANMGSKLSKGRAAYQRSVAAKHAALRTQKSYIADYNRLLGMGPNKSNNFTKSLGIRSVLTHAGKYRDSYATGFAFKSSDPSHPDNNFRWRTHADNNRHYYSINYRPASSYPGLLDSYRSKAIGAELSGIASAQAAISGIKPMDLSYIRSARGKSSSGKQTPKKNAAGFYISDGVDGTTGVTGTVTNYSNQSYQDAAAYGEARQAAETKEGKAAIDAKWQSDIQSSYLSSFGLKLKDKRNVDNTKSSKEAEATLASSIYGSFTNEAFPDVYADSELSKYADSKVIKDEPKKLLDLSPSESKVPYGWSPSTYAYLGVLPKGKTTNDETKKLVAQQQAMLDANVGTGLVTFGLDGRVSAAPKSGKIDWSQFEGMTDQKKEQVKHDIRNIMVQRDVASQISEQKAKEAELNKKIKDMESNIYFYNAIEDAPPITTPLAGIGGTNLFTGAVEATDQINKDSAGILGQTSYWNPDHKYPAGFGVKGMPGTGVAESSKEKEAERASNIYGSFASEGFTAIEQYAKIREGIDDKDTELKEAVDKRWQQRVNPRGKESGKPINWGKVIASAKISGYEKELNELNIEKTNLLKKGSTIGNAISTVGRNELFMDLYESGTFDESISGLMTINKDQDRDRQINIMKSMAQDQQGIEASISTLSKIERKLRSFNRSHRTSHKTIKDKKREELYDEIRKKLPGLNIDTDMSITDVKKAVGKISKDYSNEFKNIKNQKNELALKIAKNSTNTQRLELAESTNKTAQSKQGIEEMIGFNLSGETPSDIKSQWDKTFIGQYAYGQQVKTEEEKSIAQNKNTLREMGIGTKSGWNKNWIGGGGKDLMRGAESINLITGGKLDEKKLGEMRHGASVVKKYDGWDQAERYIGESITAYKDDITTTYKKSHRVGSVSDSTIATSWFGKPTVEGESWTLNVANNLGVREGLYAGQDIQKIVNTSEKYSSTIKNEIDVKKKELIALKEKRRLLQESHNELLPLIDVQVEKDSQAGGSRLDQNLVSKLSTSSELLYDLNYEIAEHQVAQEYYEKSLLKTDRDIEKYKDIKKQVDFQTVQGLTSGGMLNRITRSGSYGRNQANRFRRNTGSRKRTVRGGVNKRRGLGGLVT
jgi:hypothetical protein